MTSVPIPWNFWLPDSDRSTGWTNHGYVLQFVCQGYGTSPAEAWDDAIAHGDVPDGLVLPDRVVAIRDDAEHELLAGGSLRGPDPARPDGLSKAAAGC